MTKLIIFTILKWIGISIMVGTIVYGISIIDKTVITNNTSNQIDSLKNIIKSNNIIIERNNKLIDSLYNSKSQTTIKYETTIKNYSNPTIVSDDSISKFISKELYNWK